MTDAPMYDNPFDFLREAAGVDLGVKVVPTDVVDDRRSLQAAAAAVVATSAVIPGSTAGIRHVTDDHGATWFSLWDLCQQLGLKNTHVASKRLRPEHVATYRLTETGERGPAASLMVSEPGMWKLILTSRTALGRQVEALVTNEVLPAIRQRGAYLTKKMTRETTSSQDTIDYRIDSTLYEISRATIMANKATDKAAARAVTEALVTAAHHLATARLAQEPLLRLIDRPMTALTAGTYDQIRSPEIRKALGVPSLDEVHRQQAAAYADDAVDNG